MLSSFSCVSLSFVYLLWWSICPIFFLPYLYLNCFFTEFWELFRYSGCKILIKCKLSNISRNLTVFSFTFRSMVHFELILYRMQGTGQGSKFFFFSFSFLAYGCPIFPVPFVETVILFLLCTFVSGFCLQSH